MSGGGGVFVTVGTTKFEDLVEYLDDNADEVLSVLMKRGYSRLTVQFGNGERSPTRLMKTSDKLGDDFHVECFKFTQNFQSFVDQASLVVSHAGAGSILETLRSRTPLLVVVNEKLMDNHQVELAEGMAKHGYLHWCKVPALLEKLSSANFDDLAPYPRANANAFPELVDRLMGF